MKQLILLYILNIFIIPTIAQTIDESKLANEYYLQGELEKSEEIFIRLSKQKYAIPQIHSNYISLLLNNLDYEGANKYLDRALDFYPNNFQYHADRIYLYFISHDAKKKEEYQKKLLKQFEQSQYQLNLIAQNLANRELFNDALIFIKSARQANNSPHSFALDMAALYRQMNEKKLMIEEYLNYAMTNPGNVNYIKNVFQTLLNDQEDLDFLEQILISKVQLQPDQIVYAELLIWVELQRKNFYAAFIQARAIDMRTDKPGDESMKIAKIAMDNKYWQDAIDIFNYVIEKYGDSYHYANARKLSIKSKEGLVKSKYPVEIEDIRNLTRDYQSVYDEVGYSLESFDALRNKALLHAFYLNEKDTAIQLLNQIINLPRVNTSLVSSCKLSLGDIYLLNEEPWEASLLYSQVEKSNKYSEIGYEAKLKNAKLHYYTGNFILAKAHLDILKRATTKVISNDAISLGLLINNNSTFDTSYAILETYANIELLLYQNKYDKAKTDLLNLIQEHPNHSLTDESYWLLGEIELKAGNFEKSIEYLDKIIEIYPLDILGDDAFFKKGQILELQLKNLDLAKQQYRDFLDKYPGSMYAADARKRYRKLRGDIIN